MKTDILTVIKNFMVNVRGNGGAGRCWRRWVMRMGGLGMMGMVFGVGLVESEGAVGVGNVRAAQRAGTKLVDIDYDVTGASGVVGVVLEVSSDGGASWVVPVTTAVGAVGGSVVGGVNLRITWNAGVDWPG